MNLLDTTKVSTANAKEASRGMNEGWLIGIILARVHIFATVFDMQLHPTFLAFRSLCKRKDTKGKNRDYFRKKNIDRRTRRHKSAKERREKDLLRHESGQSHKSSSFGFETFSNLPNEYPSEPDDIEQEQPQPSTLN